MGSRSLPSTPLGPRTPRHSGGGGSSSTAALSSPGGDLRLHQMIAVQGRTDGSLSLSLPAFGVLAIQSQVIPGIILVVGNA